MYNDCVITFKTKKLKSNFVFYIVLQKVAGKLLRMFPSEKITEAIVRRECSSYGGGGEDIVSLIKHTYYYGQKI